MGRPRIRDAQYWKDYGVTYYQTHKESIKKDKRKYRENNKIKLSNAERFRRYGISENELYLLFNKQNKSCAICRKPLVLYSPIKGVSAHVDHDSEYGVRGILCHSCNIGIGNLQHDPFIIRAAERYLHHYV